MSELDATAEREQPIDLRGKRALVTGGSRGIGRAAALLLARAGADVGIGYHLRHEAAEQTVADMIGAYGVKAWAEAADLGGLSGALKLFERCDHEFERLDLFIASAGIWRPDYVSLSDLSTGDWDEMLSVNLTSVFYTLREAARRVEEGGKIVIVSSTAGQRGEAGHAHYAATKGALISLVKSLAVELAPRDVKVNAVAPGWVDTDMTRLALVGKARDEIVAGIPLRRLASAADIAGPILFLCSDLARHVTGEVLNVNGGSVLCG